MSALSPAERALLASLARTALPAGRTLHAADEVTVDAAAALLGRAGAPAVRAWATGARALDAWCRVRHLSAFAALPPDRRLRVMEAWRDGPGTRLVMRGLLAPLKLVHFDSPRAYGALECRWAAESPVREEPQRWQQQIVDGGALDGAGLECDVVVVGSGAGGAPIARELAARGFAVLILEEGKYFSRKDFSGRPLEMMARLYRRAGLTATLGNHVIPVPVGKGVGGTTMVNAGTCLRAPDEVLDGWRRDFGVDVDAAALAPYYARVEDTLGVAPSSPAALGRPAVVVARGADRLGWSHHPLPRNAPGCDGHGLCCFGCPTDAKRGTNVSYVPAALRAGAQLVTGVRVERVLTDGDAATGVEGTARTADGAPVRVTVRARVVVLACGALHTPALLLRSGLGTSSGHLGRHLSIHPASAAFGLFDERIDGHLAVPQGYAVDEFARDGIMFEGASAPPELLAATLQTFGPDFVDVMERYRQLLGFGFMIKDVSRGRVRLGRDGAPLMTYSVGEADVRQLRRGMVLLCRLMFAAGAREVFPGVAGFERVRGEADVDALAKARLPARAFDLSAYHPLGTARMGRDPATSVVGANHEVHDVLNLYVVDGSAVPTSLGVNPQMTIMALSLRAADAVARRLERLAA